MSGGSIKGWIHIDLPSNLRCQWCREAMRVVDGEPVPGECAYLEEGWDGKPFHCSRPHSDWKECEPCGWIVPKRHEWPCAC